MFSLRDYYEMNVEEAKKSPKISDHFDGNQIPEYIMTHYEKSSFYLYFVVVVVAVELLRNL